MNIPCKTALALIVLSAATGMAVAEPRFADATETIEELRELYDDADDMCRGLSGDTMKSRAACVTRAIYGNALNDKGWCFGTEDQANAGMEWHECTTGSLRFDPVIVPGILD
ncbi:hypothetical protein [Paracoccus onubensis]|uniref:Uncharacterized protein n=1 Tax=Paracoccus onubensis TaxID=1675788 RepID=A0A418SRZ7_9RHOB|nr:hypothetical protein [Paracoccus onubensis]RJE83647.1 hypothetical protein D3P04_14640 [Paracoccus onubensis]